MYSHSRVECFKTCKAMYKYHYLDELSTYPKYEADNPLIVGTALHTGIEKGLESAIQGYMDFYPMLSDKHIDEIIKLQAIIPLCRETLPSDGICEFEIKVDDFIGYIDYLVKRDDGTYDIYDFKYSNNIDRYMQSGQLHEYKYYFEKMTGEKVSNLYFLFAPKVSIRQRKDESLEEFRTRLRSELSEKSPTLKKVDFAMDKVDEYMYNIKCIEGEKEFSPTISRLCDWCDYKDWCLSHNDINIQPKEKKMLPENKKVAVMERVKYKKLYLYGLPFSGKTYLASKFPNALMINTDGNTKFVDSPRIFIHDEVTMVGRLEKRKFAWEMFKEIVSELETETTTYETIVVDLIEDLYEYCRLYMYKKLNITHESDDSFRAWDKVRQEFLSVIKRLIALNYNIVLISQEDDSKDITFGNGSKITSIKPNINEKVALKLAGMVDIVGRVVNNDNDRKISFKATDTIFGGGRLQLKRLEIPCTYEAINEIYEGEKK